MLKFGKANAKLKALEGIVGKVYTFSLLSGHTCPYAKDCQSKVVRENGKSKIVDGPHTIFRCFSASEESIYNNVYDNRSNHTEIMHNAVDSNAIASIIGESIPKDAKCIRVHIGGDFFNQSYFDGWMLAASQFPSILFYAYTKSLPFWLSAKKRKIIPCNFTLTASRGGYRDNLIGKHKLRQAIVIADSETCKAIIDSGNHNVVPVGKYAGWQIDHDDSHAALPALKSQSFALLVHGIQPKGGQSAQAIKVLNGVGSYSKGK